MLTATLSELSKNAKDKKTPRKINRRAIVAIGLTCLVGWTFAFLDGDKKWRASKWPGLAWGIQRNYPKRFSLDLALGLGYTFSKQTIQDDKGQFYTSNTSEFSNLVKVGLGFWLNKKK